MSHLRFSCAILWRNFIVRQSCSMQLCMSHTATLSHKQALTRLIGQCLFMRHSRSVRHAQLRAATLSLDKSCATKSRDKIAGVTSVKLIQQLCCKTQETTDRYITVTLCTSSFLASNSLKQSQGCRISNAVSSRCHQHGTRFLNLGPNRIFGILEARHFKFSVLVIHRSTSACMICYPQNGCV